MKEFAKTFNEVVRRVNAVGCEPSGTGWFDGAGLHLDGVGGGGSTTRSSWRKVSVDSATGAFVVGTGIIQHGTRAPLVIPQTTVTVNMGTSTAPAYIYLTYDLLTFAGSIVATCTTTIPRPSSPSTFQVPLHTVYMENGAVVHSRQNQWSDIIIPGTFAPP